MSSKSLSQPEQAAVAEYVRAEYDRLIAEHPQSYVARNAQVDPKGWQEKVRELIACDSKRVAAIVELSQRSGKVNGFTLIELSIVLVIIGLIVGGVLVGQSLVSAAAVRAQITQIEKFNTAANTFFDKYGYLPGDIPDPAASNFGFIPRGQYAGQGDGNGILECNYYNAYNFNYGTKNGTGETSVFWIDLSTAQLIDGYFNTASSTIELSSDVTATSLPLYMPPAKIGNGNYVYVWSGGAKALTPNSGDRRNYFGLSGVTKIDGSTNISRVDGPPALTVLQASAIDTKIDDGLPQLGNVTAIYLNGNLGGGAYWAAGAGGQGASSSNLPTTSATVGSSTTCYDNSSATTGTPGIAGATQHYSLEIGGGSNINCALSFKMQAGD